MVEIHFLLHPQASKETSFCSSYIKLPLQHKRLHFLSGGSPWPSIRVRCPTFPLKIPESSDWRVLATAPPSQVVLVIKTLPANAGDFRDTGSTPGSGRSPGERNGYPLQYSCLENTMDRGAWWVIVHKVAHSHPMDKTEATQQASLAQSIEAAVQAFLTRWHQHTSI